MVIKYGEPWLMWPNKVSYGINKVDIMETFNGSFTISLNIKILSEGVEKKTVFARLPNYVGLDVEGENNRVLLILNHTQGTEYIMSDVGLHEGYNLLSMRYDKPSKSMDIILDNTIILTHILGEEELDNGHEPHILFGSGNFPHNGFNLNYCEYDIDFLMISNECLGVEKIKQIKSDTSLEETVVGMYNFQRHTDYKVYDLTGNCNFIHKVL